MSVTVRDVEVLVSYRVAHGETSVILTPPSFVRALRFSVQEDERDGSVFTVQVGGGPRGGEWDTEATDAAAAIAGAEVLAAAFRQLGADVSDDTQASRARIAFAREAKLF
jgi:hypothetical protein